jgi:predicted membrane-bound mannosyltransferase
VVKSAPAILAAILVQVALAGVAGYLAIRLANRRSEPTVVMGFFMLAAVLGIAAIFTLTFLGKIKSG